MIQVIYLSLVTVTISFTISKAKLFLTFREWFMWELSYLDELVSCGYCLGHWISFSLVAIYYPRLFDSWWPLDYFLTALVVAWLAGFQWILFCWVMEKAGK